MTNLSDYFDKGNFYDTSDANITFNDLPESRIGYGSSENRNFLIRDNS